mgnify:CR=1 FL=1
MRQLPLEISPSGRALRSTTSSPARTPRRSPRVRALAAGELPEAIVYLWGEPGSGRTHLLRAATRANPGLVVADDVRDARRRPRSRRCSTPSTPRATARRAVLAAGGAPPARLALREDLRTPARAGAWSTSCSRSSDADKARSPAAPRPARRGPAPARGGARPTCSATCRATSASLNAVLDALDRYSLASQRPLTLPLVREALQKSPKNRVAARHRPAGTARKAQTASTSVRAVSRLDASTIAGRERVTLERFLPGSRCARRRARARSPRPACASRSAASRASTRRFARGWLAPDYDRFGFAYLPRGAMRRLRAGAAHELVLLPSASAAASACR